MLCLKFIICLESDKSYTERSFPQERIMQQASVSHPPARYLFFPLLAALIWSVNMIVTKMSAGLIAPAAIGFYRWRWPARCSRPSPCRAPGRSAPRSCAIGPLAVLGGLAMALYQGLAYVAASTTTATNMGIITAMIPLLTIVVSALVLRERPTLMALLGGLVSLAGLSLLIGEGDPARLLQVGANPGDLLMGVAALAYALYGVLLRCGRCRWGRGNRCTRRSPSARCSCCRPSCWRRRRRSMPTTCRWCSTPAYSRRCSRRSCGSRACVTWGRTAPASS